jgi:hypothetical protein
MSFNSRDLARADSALAHALADVTPGEAVIRVDGKWSPADICEHLGLAFELNAAAVAKAVADRKPRLRPASMRQRFGRWLVVKLGYFPRARSPEAVLPRGDRGLVGVDDVRRRLAALDAVLADAVSVFGEHTPFLNHPILGPFSVDDWRRFHAIHVRHHMKQVRERVGRVRRGAPAMAK